MVHLDDNKLERNNRFYLTHILIIPIGWFHLKMYRHSKFYSPMLYKQSKRAKFSQFMVPYLVGRESIKTDGFTSLLFLQTFLLYILSVRFWCARELYDTVKRLYSHISGRTTMILTNYMPQIYPLILFVMCYALWLVLLFEKEWFSCFWNLLWIVSRMLLEMGWLLQM